MCPYIIARQEKQSKSRLLDGANIVGTIPAQHASTRGRIAFVGVFMVALAAAVAMTATAKRLNELDNERRQMAQSQQEGWRQLVTGK